MSLPELQQNPLVQRVIDIFDTDQNGEVDFKGKRAFLVHLMLNSIANSFDGFVNVRLTNFSLPSQSSSKEFLSLASEEIRSPN